MVVKLSKQIQMCCGQQLSIGNRYGKELKNMSHEAHVEGKSKTATAIYTFLGLLLGAAIGGGLLYALIYLLNA
jgi:hypothetical protein